MADSGEDSVRSLLEELQTLLKEETQRRREFSEQLLKVLNRLAGLQGEGKEATVPDLVKELKEADCLIAPMLEKCLSVEDVSRREKENRPDSGYAPSPKTSSDVGAKKRQAVFVPGSDKPSAEEGVEPDHAGFPETSEPSSAASELAAMDRLPLAGPVENTDDTCDENACSL